MRIAYVCADQGVPVFGSKGCSIHVQEVTRAFLRLGARVELFTPRPEGPRPADLEGVGVHPLPRADAGKPAAREVEALAANDALAEALHREGHFDFIYERYSLWSWAGMEHARAVKVPGVLEVNAPLIEEQAEHRTLVDRGSAELTARRAFAAADALLAVSEGVASYLAGWPEAARRVHVIPNGVDPARFLPRPDRAASTTFTIGFVGSLKPWHGLATLVQAFAMHYPRNPRARLLIVGDGPERGATQGDVTLRRLSTVVRFTGAVPPDRVPGLLAEMDVGVAPYPRKRSFYFSPLKVYEYMAAGLPVVASRVGQLEGLLEHGVNGLLFPPGDADTLTAELGCLAGDSGWCRRLGEAAREKVLRQHTWDDVVRRILRLVLPSGVGECLVLGGGGR
jgi:glycosyltransferase involved in cell wall biosynthesis